MVAMDFPAIALLPWRGGTELVRFENLEGVILVSATLRDQWGRDTTGLFVVDTGAGFLGLDLDLARALGITDSSAAPAAVDLAARPLPRFTLGTLSMDQVDPVDRKSVV